jgi:hypothetical protein
MKHVITEDEKWYGRKILAESTYTDRACMDNGPKTVTDHTLVTQTYLQQGRGIPHSASFLFSFCISDPNHEAHFFVIL